MGGELRPECAGPRLHGGDDGLVAGLSQPRGDRDSRRRDRSRGDRWQACVPGGRGEYRISRTAKGDNLVPRSIAGVGFGGPVARLKYITNGIVVGIPTLAAPLALWHAHGYGITLTTACVFVPFYLWAVLG